MTSQLKKFLGKIHQGDCIAGLKKVPDGSVDLAFADPPFNIGYEYDQYDDRLESDKYLEWSSQWMSQLHRVLKPDGTFWLAIGDDYAAELKIAAQQLGFHTRNWVVWYYTFGVHCKSKFTRSHTHLFYFIKDPKKFTYNFKSVAVPSARQLVYNDKRGNPDGRSPDDTWILRPQDCVDGFTPDEDTWYFPRVAGTFKERAGFHGCQMPEQLLGRIIKACSHEGEVVVDPFSGSATTLTVAKKLGREYFGFELSTEYVKLGTRRIASAQVGDRLEGADEPKVSAPSTLERKQKVVLESACATFDSDLYNEAAGILEAFANSHRGFSADRLVADPILNEDFQNQCNRLSLPGTETDRNRFLFRLRKSGRLKTAGIRTTLRTDIGWELIDRYLHASEIAWKRVSDLHSASLDEILCDPRLAKKFDSIAGAFEPGYSELEYRWAALKLRKEVSIGRRTAEAIKTDLGAERLLKRKSIPLEEWQLGGIDSSPGLYSIKRAGEKKHYLYIGETQNLHSRLESLFSDRGKENWMRESASSTLELKLLPLNDYHHLHFARQISLLGRVSALWNLSDKRNLAA